jgi:hypothetical protein
VDSEVADFVVRNLLKTQLTTKPNTRSPITPPGPVEDKRLSLKEVEDLLRNHVAPPRVATLAEEKGIQFEVTDDVKIRLRRAGADNDLIERLTRL